MHNLFISNNRTSFHFWWKKNLVNHQKVSKYSEKEYRLTHPKKYAWNLKVLSINLSYENWKIPIACQSSDSWTTTTLTCFFIQLYWVKSDPGLTIFQISGGKFLNFYEKSYLFGKKASAWMKIAYKLSDKVNVLFFHGSTM